MHSLVRRFVAAVAPAAGLLLFLLVGAPAQFNGCGAGICTSQVAASGCSASTSFLARTSGLNATHQTAYTDLICGLVADSVFSSLDALHITATQDSTTATLNLVSSSFALSPSGTPIWAQDQGYSSSGFGDALNTQFNPATASSPKFVQNSASMGVWGYASVAANAVVAIGNRATGSSGESNLWPRFTGDVFYARLNDPATGNVSNTVTAGLLVGDRFDASTTQVYVNGSQVGSNLTSSSSSPYNDPILFLQIPGSNPWAGIISASFIGESLGATKQAALYTRLRTYMTAVGVP